MSRFPSSSNDLSTLSPCPLHNGVQDLRPPRNETGPHRRIRSRRRRPRNILLLLHQRHIRQDELFQVRVDYPKSAVDAATAATSTSQPVILPGPDTPPIVGLDAPWLNYNFETDPEMYCSVIKEYCWAGNVNNDFVVRKNPVRQWYHAPWMHWSANGREPIHGLTFERPTPKLELSRTQDRVLQTWACGFYNAAGASAFERIWRDPNNPRWDKKEFPDGFQFPVGTAVFKILMTDATNDEVPSMAGAPVMKAVIAQPPTPEQEAQSWTWQASKRNDFASDLRLLQVDFAVRDDRAPIGWVFGTFMYDGSQKDQNPWDRIIPVGLMWGNDPQLWPADAAKGAKPKESWLSKCADDLRKSMGGTRPSWGWNGRMNGPADNFISACASCHSTSQTGPRAPMVQSPSWTDAQKMHLFRNIRGTEPFGDPLGASSNTPSTTTTTTSSSSRSNTAPTKANNDRVSGDYSLQLMIGMANYQAWRIGQSLIRRTMVKIPYTSAWREAADVEAKRDLLRAGPVYVDGDGGSGSGVGEERNGEEGNKGEGKEEEESARS
ncbi:hypothetical protein EJ05DRAFT_368530 [Pseudovirgaria hyperparasitica]|uniref:Cytochrome c domain-containing protein n=1 Tax=Pseudovirgaria hyperparasitica TaxID=470096 RepID=A0A6A6W5M4_9PEZI|nr:uncharacterized protein EJ05DRAFT_368530 [Pseudovirgaria hyperparasitica]KAF2757845.1 hypothetical protein EJ05DRAFT_368530 [Pseudovirgaria hyperparasitica]